ncbi:MAG: hypothetical protein AAGA56_00825 [Myxococcota bacterium]
MSTDPDVNDWKKLGQTDNADFYEVEDGIIGIVPFRDAIDTEATAKASVDFQHRHWTERNRRGGAVIFMDRLRDSKAEARQVYTTMPDATLISGFALVGGTVFGRAVASVFLGLNKPSAPTRMFGTEEDALAWLRRQNGGGD